MRDGQKTMQARRLRSGMTDAEQTLWRYLRMRQLAGHRFRRQHPIGPYIADFCCLHARLVVEVDGGQHAVSCNDRVRDSFLERTGFRVVRFWNNDVLENIEGVVEAIMRRLELTHPHPGLPPQAGEGAKRLYAGGGAKGPYAEERAKRPYAGEGAKGRHAGEGVERWAAGGQRNASAGKVGPQTS